MPSLWLCEDGDTLSTSSHLSVFRQCWGVIKGWYSALKRPYEWNRTWFSLWLRNMKFNGLFMWVSCPWPALKYCWAVGYKYIVLKRIRTPQTMIAQVSNNSKALRRAGLGNWAGICKENSGDPRHSALSLAQGYGNAWGATNQSAEPADRPGLQPHSCHCTRLPVTSVGSLSDWA